MNKTTCPYCGVGCGVEVSSSADQNNSLGWLVRGDADHPANRGKLCSKGSALADTLDDTARLTHPKIGDEVCDWSAALDHIAQRFDQTIAQYGRDSVAFYVSGQLLTEDYYVVNKFTKGWLGTANIDTNSRLCMASSVTGHKRAFGADTVPGCYDDLMMADVIVLIGSNLAWCHPVLFQRLMAAREQKPTMRLIVIDPRKNATTDAADLHLALAPDSDAALFNGLLHHLIEHQLIDSKYITSHVSDFAEAEECSAGFDLATVASICELPEADIQRFYDWFGLSEKCVSVFSQGVNQSGCGTDKVNAIINCHLATGRIGKPGMGPFSITGQPNAMGGREVGGLATMLACHMDLDNASHQALVQAAWQSPHIASKPGLRAVELFQAIADGQIKAVWIMATNPVDSLPEADFVKQALQSCPFVVVSDVCASTDTLTLADVKLPAQAWGEKDGTVTNSERCISRQRSFKQPVGQARPDWWAVAQVAQRMGFQEAFDYSTPADIFKEYATLSGIDNNGSRDFDISACASLTDKEYDSLQPFYWPWVDGQAPTQPIRFFSNGRFFTSDAKARMIINPASLRNKRPLESDGKAVETLQPSADDDLPFILNTGRIRDQWHTMTRTGASVRLSQHLAEPFVIVHPQDAERCGIESATIARLSTSHGSVLLRALISERQAQGQLFAPMHWSDEYASAARVNKLVSSVLDPYSGQPALKHQRVRLVSYDAKAYVYGISRNKPNLSELRDGSYWALAPVDEGWQFELAAHHQPEELLETLEQLTGLAQAKSHTQTLVMEQREAKQYRQAFYADDQLQALFVVSSTPVVASRAWARQQLSPSIKPLARRWQMLAGQAGADQPDKGAIICSCYSVGSSQIKEALIRGHCKDVNDLGDYLQAGTNCGSCRSELQLMVGEVSQTLNRKCTTSPSCSR